MRERKWFFLSLILHKMSERKLILKEIVFLLLYLSIDNLIYMAYLILFLFSAKFCLCTQINCGVYKEIKRNHFISYILDDDRTVNITFHSSGSVTEIVEVFEAENTNEIEHQRFGWQSILENFKKYVERNNE